MGWINSHVVTTKPFTDIKGNLIPKGTEFIVIYGSKRENCNVASFRSCENGKVYRFPWDQVKEMVILPDKLIISSAFI